jgi:hypothetical protein
VRDLAPRPPPARAAGARVRRGDRDCPGGPTRRLRLRVPLLRPGRRDRPGPGDRGDPLHPGAVLGRAPGPGRAHRPPGIGPRRPGPGPPGGRPGPARRPGRHRAPRPAPLPTQSAPVPNSRTQTGHGRANTRRLLMWMSSVCRIHQVRWSACNSGTDTALSRPPNSARRSPVCSAAPGSFTTTRCGYERRPIRPAVRPRWRGAADGDDPGQAHP